MPWTVADVNRHKAGLSDAQKRAWVKVANSTLSDCTKDGGSQKFCEAKAIRIASYAAGRAHKEIDMSDEELGDLVKEANQELDEKGFVPWGIVTFDELEEYRTAQDMAKQAHTLTEDFMGLVFNAMGDPETTDKAAAVKELADEFAARVKQGANESQPSLEEGEEEKEGQDGDDLLDFIMLVDEIDEDGNIIEEEKAKRSDVSAADRKRAVAEYGNVRYADPANKKYPVDTEKHIRAAWSYIGMPKNQAKYPDKGAAIKRRVIAAWKRVIDKNGPPKGGAKEIVDSVVEAIKELFSPLLSNSKTEEKGQKEAPADNSLMFYKEADGTMRWMARYSNNIRDDDRPREIISAKSHMRYIDLVDKGEAPPPQLWVWHIPEWKLGTGTWVAYDDSGQETGFALAAGIVDKGMEPVAEFISKQQGVCLSHGMPVASIRRDEGDPTVIVEHVTKEISILPRWAAANKFTSFIVLGNEVKENDMAIPENKIRALTEEWGEEAKKHLDALIQHNAQDAGKALEEGRDTKEVTKEEGTDTSTTTTATEETTEQYATVADINEAFGKVVAPFVQRVEEQGQKIDQLTAALEGLRKELDTSKEKDAQNIEKVISQTPSASLAAMLANTLGMSAVGSPETKVDGRTELAHSHPKETPAVVMQRTGIPFIDNMLNQPGEPAGEEKE